MNNIHPNIGQFFGVMGNGQAYLNLVYLGAAFPLGILYFVFLVSGLSTGVSLVIIWVGIPILLLVGAGWWILASFERYQITYLLKVEIIERERPSHQNADTWTRLKDYLINPVTWKSLVFLFMKFPLGIATFLVLVTLLALTLGFLTMPLMYAFFPHLQPEIFAGPGTLVWEINSLGDSLICSLIGLMLWPVTLHITNGLAWIHAKFAKVMLSVDLLD